LPHGRRKNSAHGPIIVPPRSIAEKTDANIQRWTEMEKGGHFAAMEQPAALAAEIQDFSRQLR
jgi:pimeloyl-ACP methyl ester carboxylesterase